LALSLSLLVVAVRERKRSRHAKVMSLLRRVRLPYSACIPSSHLWRGWTLNQTDPKCRRPPSLERRRKKKTLNGLFFLLISTPIDIFLSLLCSLCIAYRYYEGARPRSLPGRGELGYKRLEFDIKWLASITLSLPRSVCMLLARSKLPFLFAAQ
jgi:hypothetical protein